jgi:hypothetical protein
MVAAARFVAAGSVGAQRWAGPVLLFAVGLAVTFVSGGNSLAILAQGAAWLFPISAWLVVATLNTEDAGQAAVTDVVLGGPTKARALKLAVAGTAALGMAIVSLVLAVGFVGGRVSVDQLALGASAHVLCVIGGSTAGLLCARPLVGRPGWAASALMLICVVELAVPHVPPVRAVVDVLDHGTGTASWPAVSVIAAETLLGCFVAGAGAFHLARRRS